MMAHALDSRSDGPAILGGSPLFPEGLPLVRPSIPDIERITKDVRSVLSSGVLTNGRLVRELEERTAVYLGVDHCIAVASCTAGLMLVLRAANLTGDVVVPSFTFAATAHAVVWNGLRPVFADVDPETLTLSPQWTSRYLGARSVAVLATHTFGTPCDVESLQEITERAGARLFFDAAHAFGSRRKGVSVGNFGDAEVFSLSPTKVLVAGEGGIIATDDDELAERCRVGRDYGNPGDYDCLFVGLNARMSELHAAVALASLEGIDQRIERRNSLARTYREGLEAISGITTPRVHEGDLSTYKDFTILLDSEIFGVSRDRVREALEAEGIETRRYYCPPVHSMRAYRNLASSTALLPATDRAASQVITLPLWSEMSETYVNLVVDALARIQKHASALRVS